MTIAVVWQENDCMWCAADTRIVYQNNQIVAQTGSKIFSIPVVICAQPFEGFPRAPHYWTQYGFVFAGSSSPAITTAMTASTLLQKLTRFGEQSDPPRFELVASFVAKIAQHIAKDRRSYGADGEFNAAFFGWCPHENRFMIAQIELRSDSGSFRAELTYPAKPQQDGEAWIKIGSGASNYNKALNEFTSIEPNIKRAIPRRVIEKMISDEKIQSVGGSVTLGYATRYGFELCSLLEPIEYGKPQARMMFNGLDLHTQIGNVGGYHIGLTGFA